MKLIGMLDSPYVRRVAISLQYLSLPFAHESVSVFRNFEQFHAINPVVKAPTLVAGDGTVLMDSTLMLDYAETLASGKTLMPIDLMSRLRTLSLIGLALAACEKSVQLYYERTLRPEDKRHQPWVDRVTGQLLAAYGELEREITQQPLSLGHDINQAGITTAVAWAFTQHVLADVVAATDFPQLAAMSAEAETLPIFKQWALSCV